MGRFATLLVHAQIKCACLAKLEPWSIPLELFKRTILASAPQDVVWNGPGISRVEYLSCNSGIVRTRISELTECAWADPWSIMRWRAVRCTQTEAKGLWTRDQ